MWCVCFSELSNGDIYVGSTDDLRRRVASSRPRRFETHLFAARSSLGSALFGVAAFRDLPELDRDIDSLLAICCLRQT